MKNETPHTIYLKDYQPPAFAIESVHLDIRLHDTQSEVRASLAIKPVGAGAALRLDLDGIAPHEVRINGSILELTDYTVDEKYLTIAQVPASAFTLETDTFINPKDNTQLSGLYMSDGIFCTQCEPEGFRRITPYLDRPDVLAKFTTRIEGDKSTHPILLGNGNKIESGELGAGRHFAVWEDPFPKPAYLFAMVGGTLASVKSHFVTMSGRNVALEIYVEPGKENRCAWAMESLKRSMAWDEQAFGREYDLDIFMIVAVSNFTFGAMENKGLNIFNDKLLLADPETATDKDYERIEAVIAHEYFHNWTGDRITCRDWFQLCLKEGFTVFRDQEFTSDIHSRPVKRIEDVQKLRNTQFVEDASPLAHAVRPDRYSEINNFYTTTIYEKGAELIRMLKILLGPVNFRKGSDLYFDRFDGQAVRMEDFIDCMAEAGKIDLSQFMLWYNQAGTPRLNVSESYDAAQKLYTLNFTQTIPDTPGQTGKQPHVIPVVLGLLGKNGELPLMDAKGSAFASNYVVVDTASKSFSFKADEKPLPSLLRDFSAPVNLDIALEDAALARLAMEDSDAFNRWQALQELGLRRLLPLSKASTPPTPASLICETMRSVLQDEKAEQAFRALCLSIPTDLDICRALVSDVDPAQVYNARKSLSSQISTALCDVAKEMYLHLATKNAYLPDAENFGRRSLRNTLLKIMTFNGDADALKLAQGQLEGSDNLTDRVAALVALSQNTGEKRDNALHAFETRYASEPLVLDKWLSVQAMADDEATIATIQKLTQHPVFSWKTPNRIYALLNTFAQSNLSQFHRADGAGYAYIADCVLKLEPILPQVGARLMTAFRCVSWLEPKRKALALAEVQKIASTPSLSADVADLSTRLLSR